MQHGLFLISRYFSNFGLQCCPSCCYFCLPLLICLQRDEDEEKTNRKWATCPKCYTEVPYQPTRTEWREMFNEAILRLLQAEKVRQLLCFNGCLELLELVQYNYILFASQTIGLARFL